MTKMSYQGFFGNSKTTQFSRFNYAFQEHAFFNCIISSEMLRVPYRYVCKQFSVFIQSRVLKWFVRSLKF